MFRSITTGLLVGTAIIALMGAANTGHAQTSESNSNAVSGSNAESRSGSSSRATSNSGGNRTNQNQNSTQGVTANTNTGVTLNQTTNTPETLRTNNTSTNSGTYTNQGHTSSDVTVRSAPQVYAPPVSGGNPCTLAVSGGISVIGWGAAAGGTFVDTDCANRQKIAMIHNSGRADLAFALMCNDKDTYLASKRTLAPCAPNMAFEPPGAVPTPVVMPTQLPGPAPVVQVTPRAAVLDRSTLPRCRGPNDQGPCFSG